MTPKQYKLYSFIRNQIVHSGKAPTFSEMKKHMVVTSNQTIGDWLSILERDGYISINKGKLRGIAITEKGMKGFDYNLQIQQSEAIKKPSISIYDRASTNFNIPSIQNMQNDKGIIMNSENAIPAWKGGEKNGSS
ncbi:MAG TPA: hypothetical protein VK338_00025 [Candidatus Nitrosocosmicus sp.]|nr:hypothetical protein [Candidatus Nitrosocosmicus sp.]